ncbi:MAG TPA: hypothetical protein DHV85_14115 [Candidatus Accumulibacter sp.]|nr:hypothetical protein [Accumulibacter sp.]
MRLVLSCARVDSVADLNPAETTHGRITPEQRAAAGVSEDLLRIAVGLEAVVDLQNDLDTGLSAI